MPEIADFVGQTIAGDVSQAEHHKIAALLVIMSDAWATQELTTGIRPAEAFAYSVGLIMGRELVYFASPDKLAKLGKAITDARKVK